MTRKSAEESRGGPCRGVATWASSSGARWAALCQTRILTGTVDGRLIALDARSGGQLCEDFGDSGTVNALEGLGEHPLGEYRVDDPGRDHR